MPALDVSFRCKDGGALGTFRLDQDTCVEDWLEEHANMGKPSFIVASSSSSAPTRVGARKVFSILLAFANLEDGTMAQLAEYEVQVRHRMQA